MQHRALADLFNLTGNTAIVTGAGQGLGQAIAYRLAEAGAKVAVVARQKEKAAATVAEIHARGGEALAIVADASIKEEIDHAVQTTVDRFGGVDLLVNNAGGMHPFTPVADLTEEIFDATLDRNLKSCFFMSQRVLDEMIKSSTAGRIINISSVESERPFPFLTVYSASKAGVSSLTKSMACEFARYGIQINAIAPGPVRTPNTASAYDDPQVAAQVIAKVPLGRIADVDEIATSALFLASDAASFITGTTLFVDGGFTAL